jgi:hypothetical protein
LAQKDHKITRTNKQPLTLSDERERPPQNFDRDAGRDGPEQILSK